MVEEGFGPRPVTESDSLTERRAGPEHRLSVAISSRALFNLDASHRVFEEKGVDDYCRYQIDHEDDVLAPGVAFALATKLLRLNRLLDGRASVQIVLLSRNSADTGLRIFNSIQHYGLDISRAAFTGGGSPFAYAAALGAHLFLSANAGDVRQALDAGMAAATILPGAIAASAEDEEGQLRIAFDGDAVLFSDEAERIYQSRGLEAFEQTEREAAREPLTGGPFKEFLTVLHKLQRAVPPDASLIRTALITARGAPAHERVIRTLRAWDIRIDEALFLGGLDKAAFLKAFRADIFFDDQQRYCDAASPHVPTGHVPHGIANSGG